MRQVATGLVVAIVLAFVNTSWAAAAPPNTAELQALTLTLADLPVGWTVISDGPLEVGVASYGRTFMYIPPNPVLAISSVTALLYDGRIATTRAAAESYASAFAPYNGETGYVVTLEATAVLPDGIRIGILGRTPQGLLAGEVFVWRRGEVLALAGEFGEAQPEGRRWALRQDARLRGVR